MADHEGRGAPSLSRDTAPETLRNQLHRVQDYWWLVGGVMAVCLLAGIAATISTPTTYTGRASLIVSSSDRAPEQDAVLVQGYADYFNGGAYQSKLTSEGTLKDGVAVSAEVAAGSPILLIDATASDPEVAQSAAAEVAGTFSEDVGEVRLAENSAELTVVQGQFNRYQTLIAKGSPYAPSESVMSALQDRILQLRASQVNVLQELQFDGGVTEQQPSWSTNILLALMGGLILGILAALLASEVSRRITSRQEAISGLSPLVEVPEGGRADVVEERRLRFRQLAEIVAGQLPGRAAVAVTEPVGGNGTAMVARGLARRWAEQGQSTLLVRANADGDASLPEDCRVDCPDERISERPVDATWGALDGAVLPGPVSGMWVLRPDQLSSREGNGEPRGLDRDKVRQLLDRAELMEISVIIEAPPVVESADGHLLCDEAGRTLLVVEDSRIRSSETAEAVSLLTRSSSDLLGAVHVLSADGDDRRLDRPTAASSGQGRQHAASSDR